MFVLVALALAGSIAAGPAPALVAADRGLTLEEAVEAAFEHSPELAAGQAEVAEARARLATARTYPYNPEVSLAGGRRSGPGGGSTDRGVELSQEIEIGGQRGRRIAFAEAELRASEARFERRRRELAGRVSLAYAEAVLARELLRIEESDAALAHDLLAIEERRLEAGKATQIELNLARSIAGRSAGSVELAKGAYLESRGLLAESIGWPPASPPEPMGALARGEEAAAASPPLADLVREALENREDLAAWRRREEAARAEIALERSLARPNLVASVFSDREEGTDDITGLALSVGIPLFNRNRGPLAVANAAAQRVAAEAALARLAVEREVAAAYALYQAASAASRSLDQHVIGSLEESLGLLQRSLDAGKISRTEIFLLRREFVDSQRQVVNVLAAAWRARVALDLAVGRLPIPSPTNRSPEP